MGRPGVSYGLLVCGLALALAFVAPAAGQEDPAAEKAAVDARIAELQDEIDAAKAEEGVLTSQLSAVVDELESAQLAVEDAESTLGVLEAELQSEQLRLDELNAKLAEQTRRLEILERELARAVAILERRVRAIYIEETPDVLSFLVSATSFDDVIDSYEFLSRIGEQDSRIAQQVEAAKVRAAAERKATAETRKLQQAVVSVIAARTDEARVVRDRLASDRDTLGAARQLKASALATSRESRQDYLAEVDALAQESASLAAAIRQSQTNAGSTGSGVSSSGFIWPCEGYVVSGFGMRWGRMHEGIDISCSYGTPIWAAAEGTVIWSGWRGGYGNAVVVDHGNGLATLYAHASALLVSVGQTVSQGETVALIGSTGNSSGPHLHFEVRVNGTAVDPLLYL